MMMFEVTEENKIEIINYDSFSTDVIYMVNDFNNMNTYYRSLSLYELTCRLKDLAR